MDAVGCVLGLLVLVFVVIFAFLLLFFEWTVANALLVAVVAVFILLFFLAMAGS